METDRESLKWVIEVARPDKLPQNKTEWKFLCYRIFQFARIAWPAPPGIPTGVKYGRVEKYVLDLFHDTTEQATKRMPIDLPHLGKLTPGLLVWDKKKNNYQEIEDPQQHTVTRRVATRLRFLIKNYGRLIKICKAPAKRPPGRKPKRPRAKAKSVGICSRRFLARKETQLYCSPTCANRVITRRKREG